jgi:large subunit ribosomal protein L4
VLSSRAAEESVTVVDSFALAAPKPIALLEVLSTLGASQGALIVLSERSDGVLRAARNLDNVHVVTPNGLNLLDLLRLPRLILAEAALSELTRTLTADLAAEATKP